ncbi:MAG: hypothetical protein A3F26_02740 [Candidatus Ryanbacteria bacterium RIFCSPHIGHO2_12_FULL_47_12b]|uniref:Glycosyltransferase RgtA/B/C/D-like domain-containing protein n=1 Tax=Candidatus Ryanbacteria bacterium RIFCSPLOWO2_02_FULL_47_14 TaxID=1802129 RepID=A0A1G2H018_9BACT|nr:MAG: Dolichyl-phosphate-mannose-protein mannosyltransferase [Parcubacteria group bacterium GW2011_GWA2_47_10b]KKU86030.1 MAG: Dolichyl-phosphate-mannose-protein mannosyltransferase [Parcubacteria group bacterium GW2011_GWA1_47_9]OGZ44525.1 MAG: hypothetical protein A2844_00735 [Candidatus Ryanbacteria bacterium RIFCSPHIGHO2_01_FULL_48_80]OGZ50268.1 MAG: hypothetical protein A3C83_02610 [Candidatus Ryanbacteria bacterium RIFCSPHIGHO2_02_FULL_47_25]OGZ51513.1 MAG: hypothetical protein A3A29_00
MRASVYLPLIAITSFALFLALYRLGDPPLIDYDEATYAQVLHESIAHSNFFTFTKGGSPWIDKPPLYFLLMGASTAILGEDEFAMRLPAALLTVGSIFLLWLIARRLTSDKITAFAASFILATTLPFLEAGRQVRLDMGVVFSVLLATYCFLKSFDNKKWLLGFWTSIAFGFLFKSVLAFLAIIPITAVFSFTYRQWNWLKSRWFWAGAILFLVIVIPWLLYQHSIYGPTFWQSFIGFQLRHLQPIIGEQQAGYWYYVKILLSVQPWINLFIISCVWLIITLPRSRQKIASAVIVIFIFIFFEIAQSKLGYYLLPLYPFMALSIALTLAPILKNSSNYRTTARVLAIAIGIYAAASAVLNIQAPQKRDLLLRYSDAVTTRDIALDEKYIGKFLAREKIPVYLYKWPYHETLYYYGNAPELITVTQSKQPTDPPYFLVIPTDFVTSNQVRFNSVSVEFIYQGPIGTLFRTKN